MENPQFAAMEESNSSVQSYRERTGKKTIFENNEYYGDQSEPSLATNSQMLCALSNPRIMEVRIEHGRPKNAK